VDREDDYRKRRLNRQLSPSRNDAFAMGDRTPANDVRTYGEVLRDAQLQRETDNTLRYQSPVTPNLTSSSLCQQIHTWRP